MSAQTKPISTGKSPSHVLILCGLLIGVLAVGWYLRGRQVREWWISRQSPESLKRAAESQQADPLTRLIYADKLIKAGRTTEAGDVLRKAEQSLPPGATDSVAARVNARLGYLLAREGDDTEAVTYLERARKINDEDPLVPMGFGLVFLHRQMLDFADTQFKIVTTLDPNNAAGWYLLGKASNQNAKPQQAVIQLKKSIALKPNFGPAHAELGHAYAYQALFPQAVEEFRMAVKLEPTNSENDTALGAAVAMSARTRAQYEEAVKLLDKSMKEQPNNENLSFTLGQLHLRFNNLEEARIHLIRSTKLRPAYAEAWYNLARVEERLGDATASKRANDEFQRLSSLHDNAVIAEKRVAANVKDSKARIELARRYHDAGNLIGAYWQYLTAMKMEPDNKALRTEYLVVAKAYQKIAARRGVGPKAKDDVNSMGPPPPAELMSDLKQGAPAVGPNDR